MLKPRVIPVLLLKNEGLVKTRKFDDYTYIGDPVNAVKIFNLKEVDELIFLDIDASKKNLEPNFDLIEDIASEAFMPFSYGGGVNNINQIRRLLRIGVEKIIINTGLNDVEFIKNAVKTFGSSTIIASIDFKTINSRQYIYNHCKKNINTKIEIFNYIKYIENLGVGEIMINSVDRDGLFLGYDINFLNDVSSYVGVPVIGCGGAKNISDIKKLFDYTTCSAAAAGSIFVFYGKHNAVLITYPDINEFNKL
jgi:cyclase